MNTPSLSVSHNWRNSFSFSISIHYDIAFITTIKATRSAVGGGKRGKITIFTNQARKRMLERLAAMRNCENGFFATLTYPGSFEYTAQQCKNHLILLRKRMQYYCPDVRVIWRMDRMERKSGASKGDFAPHYHLLIYGIDLSRLEKFRMWLHETWSEIANYHDRNVPMLRTECKEIVSHKQAMSYAAKYMCEVDKDDDKGFGRYWGTFGKFDESASIVIQCTYQTMVQFRRLCRSWLKSRNQAKFSRRLGKIREDYSFSIFGIGDATAKDTYSLAERFALAASC